MKPTIDDAIALRQATPTTEVLWPVIRVTGPVGEFLDQFAGRTLPPYSDSYALFVDRPGTVLQVTIKVLHDKRWRCKCERYSVDNLRVADGVAHCRIGLGLNDHNINEPFIESCSKCGEKRPEEA